jgi:hypothetical protein
VREYSLPWKGIRYRGATLSSASTGRPNHALVFAKEVAWKKEECPHSIGRTFLICAKRSEGPVVRWVGLSGYNNDEDHNSRILLILNSFCRVALSQE